MRISMIMCKQTQPLFHIPNGGEGLSLSLRRRLPLEKEKVVIVMGPTGTGKSRLSIDLATHFPSEIINSDKIQCYEGLDITTNKISEEEQREIPHHLLGTINPNLDFTSSDFCNLATLATNSIHERGNLPIIVGGSNSYVEALMDGKNSEFQSKYECCFLWVDVSLPVLNSFLSERVDRMVENGMVDEVKEFFLHGCDYTRGIRKAIGVPELDEYFRMEPYMNKATKLKVLRKAINDIKTNTKALAYKQLEKIYRLMNVKGWNLHRLDATEVFRREQRKADEAWEREVAGPGLVIVSRFLHNVDQKVYGRVAITKAVTMNH